MTQGQPNWGHFPEKTRKVVAGVGIEPTTRGFSEFHRQKILQYFKHLERQRSGATQVRQAPILYFDGTLQVGIKM